MMPRGFFVYCVKGSFPNILVVSSMLSQILPPQGLNLFAEYHKITIKTAGIKLCAFSIRIEGSYLASWFLSWRRSFSSSTLEGEQRGATGRKTAGSHHLHKADRRRFILFLQIKRHVNIIRVCKLTGPGIIAQAFTKPRVNRPPRRLY